jgi:hypothetical protein
VYSYRFGSGSAGTIITTSVPVWAIIDYNSGGDEQLFYGNFINYEYEEYSEEYENDAGCTDIDAYNYDSDATEDDGSCMYAEDCAGECGGSAVEDECGVCGGDNDCDSSAGCVDDPNGLAAGGPSGSCANAVAWFGCDGFAFGQFLVSDECPVTCDTCPVDCENEGPTSHGCCLPDNNFYINETGKVFYNTTEGIGGFQFIVDGATPISASGGDAGDVGMTLQTNTSTNMVLGFSITGTPIPAGCGTLVELVLDGDATGLSEIVVADAFAFPLYFEYYEITTGCMDSAACNYDPSAAEDDGSCEAGLDECGVCGGSGIPDGDCDCTGNVDAGCGCDEAGPSGCDNQCGSTLENDECGVCGGDGSTCGPNIIVDPESISADLFVGDMDSGSTIIFGPHVDPSPPHTPHSSFTKVEPH